MDSNTTKFRISPGVFSAAFFVVVLGYGGNGLADQYGVPISDRNATPVSVIFEDPESYAEKTVTIQGTVDMQDQRGYWFYVTDKEFRMYVEIDKGGFTMPDLINTRVLVEGVIEVKLNIPSLFATGVETRQ
jgi:hypothetical protein